MPSTCSRTIAATTSLRDRGETLGDDDDRTLVDLLVEQIEFADVVVLNKIGDARPSAADAARKHHRGAQSRCARSSRPTSAQRAARRRPRYRAVRFRARRAQHPLWYKELYGFADHVPETEEYGVQQLRLPRAPAVRSGRDFLPRSNGLAGVIRAKGHFWLATRPDRSGCCRSPAPSDRTEPKGGFWWATVPRAAWPRSRPGADAQPPLERRLGRPPAGTGLHRRRHGLKTPSRAFDACLVSGKPGMRIAECGRARRSVSRDGGAPTRPRRAIFARGRTIGAAPHRPSRTHVAANAPSSSLRGS